MDSQKRSEILLLIQARLYGQSGSYPEKARRLNLSLNTIDDLMNGNFNNFTYDQLIEIAKKTGISHRLY